MRSRRRKRRRKRRSRRRRSRSRRRRSKRPELYAYLATFPFTRSQWALSGLWQQDQNINRPM